jgi:glycosyltransferase involved in cell wall biosynthesis
MYNTSKKKVLFYSSVKTKRMFSIQGFYRTDIQILRENGFEVLLSKHFWDFFLFWKYDIAFIYFYRFGLFPAIISKLFFKKVFFTGGIDDLDLDYAGVKKYFIQKIFFKLCNLFSDTSIVVSKADLKNIQSIYVKNRLPKNLELSFHVIDFDSYKYTFTIEKQKVMTTIAWMLREENVFRKGVDKTVEVFDSLLKIDNEWKLMIIGPKGKGTEIIEKLIQEKGIEKSVFLLGSISEEEKINFLKISTIYMQLSVYEGFGIAAIEALAAGNIVFHSGKGGLKDGVSNFGIEVENLSDSFQIASLIHSTLQIKSNQNHIEFLNNGISYVEQNFSYPIRKKLLKEIMLNK